jgi:hypothetical protein
MGRIQQDAVKGGWSRLIGDRRRSVGGILAAEGINDLEMAPA